jgi:hypothetical protein
MRPMIGERFHRPVCSLTVALVIACVYTPPLSSAADGDLTHLAELARQQKESTALPSTAAVQKAKKQLAAAVASLNSYLTPSGKNGVAWKQYLRFDDLSAAVEPDSAVSDDALEATLRQFRANHSGLELPVFQNVGSAIQRYLQVAGEQAQSTTLADVNAKLDELAQRLEQLADPPPPDKLAELGDLLGWLNDRGQALELVSQIRDRLSQPNLRVHVSHEVIATGGLRRIKDQPHPFHDVILGTSIVGTGRTTGWAHTRLLPDPSRAMFETCVVATNRAQTVGYNGPARIASASTTQLSGTKRFYVDGTGFHVWSAASRADSHTQIRGIWSNRRGLGDRIVRRVASKRAAQQKRAAERVAAQHAQKQLSGRIDAEANAQLGRAHQDFVTNFRTPLLRFGQWPRNLHISTTATQFSLVALHDSPQRLAAPATPPKLPDNVAMAVQMHESLVNNYGDGLLAGRILQQDEVDRLSVELFGRRPEQVIRDDEKGPWSVTFGSREPLVLRVDGGRASLTLRGQRFGSTDRVVNRALDVTAHYRLYREDNAAKAIRDGDVEVYPTGFIPNGDRRLTLRESRDASYVRNRFDDFFTDEITSHGLVLPGQWGSKGRLDLVELDARDGWLTLAWRQGDQNEAKKQ